MYLLPSTARDYEGHVLVNAKRTVIKTLRNVMISEQWHKSEILKGSLNFHPSKSLVNGVETCMLDCKGLLWQVVIQVYKKLHTFICHNICQVESAKWHPKTHSDWPSLRVFCPTVIPYCLTAWSTPRRRAAHFCPNRLGRTDRRSSQLLCTYLSSFDFCGATPSSLCTTSRGLEGFPPSTCTSWRSDIADPNSWKEGSKVELHYPMTLITLIRIKVTNS